MKKRNNTKKYKKINNSLYILQRNETKNYKLLYDTFKTVTKKNTKQKKKNAYVYILKLKKREQTCNEENII